MRTASEGDGQLGSFREQLFEGHAHNIYVKGEYFVFINLVKSRTTTSFRTQG